MKKILLHLLLLPLLGGQTNLFSTDLAVQIAILQKTAVRGDTIAAVIKIENQGKTEVNNLVVQISFSEGLKYVSQDKQMGNFSPTTGLWNIGKLNERSPGTQILLLLLVEGEGPLAVQAEIYQHQEKDSDSVPGNGKMGEDDLAFGVVSVPIVFCGSDTISLIAEAREGFTGYQWLRDGKKMEGATARRLHIQKVGRYTCQADQTGNREDASFPVIVQRAAALRATLPEKTLGCAGETLKIRPEILEGNPPYRFRWSSDDGRPIAQKLKAGETRILTAIITDAVGCMTKVHTQVIVDNCK